MGRWKGDGKGGSYYDPNDQGPDQMTPPTAPAAAGQSGAPGSPAHTGPPPNPWTGGFTGRGQKPDWWDEWQTPGQGIPMPGGPTKPFDPTQPWQNRIPGPGNPDMIPPMPHEGQRGPYTPIPGGGDPGMLHPLPWYGNDTRGVFGGMAGPGGGAPGAAGPSIPQGSGVWQSLIDAIMKGQSGMSQPGGGAGGGGWGSAFGGAPGGLTRKLF